jgi:hypothetical protein
MEQEIFKNRREAALLGTKMSFALITISAVSAICFTIGACFFLKGHISFLGNGVLFASYLCLITSVFAGSQGIVKVRNNGFNGKWDLSIPREDFTYQTIFLNFSCILYFLFLVISV